MDQSCRSISETVRVIARMHPMWRTGFRSCSRVLVRISTSHDLVSCCHALIVFFLTISHSPCRALRTPLAVMTYHATTPHQDQHHQSIPSRTCLRLNCQVILLKPRNRIQSLNATRFHHGGAPPSLKPRTMWVPTDLQTYRLRARQCTVSIHSLRRKLILI